MKKIHYLFIVFVCIFLGIYLTSCNSSKVATPSNIQIDENNNLIWDKVNDARSYEIKFLYVDDNTVETDQTRKVLYNLDNLKEGDYEISISSISGTNAKNSDFSTPILFHKYFETGCVYTLINNNSEYAITKVGKASGTFVIEDYYRNKAVTEIAENAFKGSTKVEGITIGANVESIGKNAFYNCPKLTNIVIPESVRSIGASAFQNCRAIKSINIPKSIISLPEYTFAYCRGLEEVTLPDTLEDIGESCFQDCSSLKELVIPDSVTSIAKDSFAVCASLEKVSFGKGLETIGENAFVTCSSLQTVNFSNNSSLKVIGTNVFGDCKALVNVDLPDGLEEIGDTCFMGCSKLETVTIPDSVKSVGYYAFLRTKLQSSQIRDENILIYADKWVVGYNPSKDDQLANINSEIFRSDTVGIAEEVFSTVQTIKTVTTPKTLKYIGQQAFANCTNLWKFTTSENSLKSVGDYAFAYCNLTNVSFGVGLEEIGSYAFLGNTQLDNNSLSPYNWIPETVSRIGAYAFYNTKLWNSPRDGGNIVYAGNWVVGYKNDNLGSVVLSFDTNRVAGVADYAFQKSTSLTSITGLANCKYIGEGAFYNCENLASVSLNRGLVDIKPYTFYNCKTLVKVTFPRTLKTIGDYAFYNCELLESVDLETTDTISIGDSAFRNCTNLKELLLSDYLEEIGALAFYNCVNILEVNLPDTLTKLGKKAFYKNLALKTLTIGTGLEVIPEAAFYNCESLTEIVIPNNIKTIGRKAFYNCTTVASLTLGDNVETISDYAFYGNKNIEELKFNVNLKSIGNYAFKGLEKVKTIILPKTIIEIGQHAFYGCKSMTIYTDATELLPHWHARLNSGRRPMFYGVTFDEQGKVLSIVVSKDLLINKNATGGISAPADNFSGWRDDENKIYSMEDIVALEIEGSLKLYAIYE